MATYRPRHARPCERPLPALLITPPVTATAHTPIGTVALSTLAALTAVTLAVRRRLVRTAARTEEISKPSDTSRCPTQLRRRRTPVDPTTPGCSRRRDPPELPVAQQYFAAGGNWNTRIGRLGFS